ncbi:MAG: hypothetical protein D6729_08250 [Deltaproteobacteria bacterium]|nr:MAG: hypothetical protein D6729_08250 [Deltaproteobacteria bacterium]
MSRSRAARPLEDEADFVVVGTGAGGATAARVLAGAGHSVLLLEEGPHLSMDARPREMLPTMRDLFRDMGSTLALGPAPFPVLQGRVVGGSTAINSGIIWRLPEAIRRHWAEAWGLGEVLTEERLTEAFERIEAETHVAPTGEAVLGGNASVLARGAAALGLEGHPTRRNAAGCQGSARCLQGCPTGAKQSMDRSYVPRALRDGARLHALARVERVEIRGGRAVGVTGHRLEPATRRPVAPLRIRARRGVVVSAGVVHTPLILQHSGLKRLVGERFQAHPGTAVVARFPEPVGMGFGATQAYQVPCFERGYKIESLSLPPEMLAARLPGTGAAWQRRLAELDHYAQWAVMCRMEAKGRIRRRLGGGPKIHYAPTQRDLERLRDGIVLAARLFFAAGASEVYPWMSSRPPILRRAEEIRYLEEGPVTHRDFHLMATHLFGTAVAGADPSRSVVGPTLESHSVGGLYVMDASVFPTNIGVNPQHSIMGVVWCAAERLANESAVARPLRSRRPSPARPPADRAQRAHPSP